MRLTACAEPGLDLPPARCIDAQRLSDVTGRPIQARQRGNRPGCLCTPSRDIGAYDGAPRAAPTATPSRTGTWPRSAWPRTGRDHAMLAIPRFPPASKPPMASKVDAR